MDIEHCRSRPGDNIGWCGVGWSAEGAGGGEGGGGGEDLGGGGGVTIGGGRGRGSDRCNDLVSRCGKEGCQRQVLQVLLTMTIYRVQGTGSGWWAQGSLTGTTVTLQGIGPGGGGSTQSGKRYQLRSDLLGAVAVASRHG